MPSASMYGAARSSIAGPSVARRLPRAIGATRAASTQPSRESSRKTSRKPKNKTTQSSPPPSAPDQPNPAPVQRHSKVVSRLVALHHASAGFMRNTTDVTHAFENNFKQRPQPPRFESLDKHDYELTRRMTYRKQAGVLNLLAKSSPAYSDLTTHATRIEAGRRPAPLHMATFRPQPKQDASSFLDSGFDEDHIKLTDRELQLKEALFGTWERGGQGMKAVMPGYDGVMEYLAAKKSSVTQAARGWTLDSAPVLPKASKKKREKPKAVGPVVAVEDGQTLDESITPEISVDHAKTAEVSDSVEHSDTVEESSSMDGGQTGSEPTGVILGGSGGGGASR